MREGKPPPSLRGQDGPVEDADSGIKGSTLTQPDGAGASSTIRAAEMGVEPNPVDDGYGPGRVIDDKYEILGMLGRGGMGTVFAAKHRTLETLVAIKVLGRELARRPDGANRLLREARSAAQLNHENVVRVFDVGTLESGAPFIVMERLFGADLDQVLRERGALPPREAAEYVVQACRGLAHAHARGFVHRDLKPANLFLCQDENKTPTLKLLDFGISKHAAPSTTDGELTQEGDLLGSPQYMSPEQLRSSRSVDFRSDIWSLGVILYRLVTGVHPFRARNLTSLAVAIASDPPSTPGESQPHLPRELERIVTRCLEKDRERRFASVRELERELLDYLGRAPRGSRSKRLALGALVLVGVGLTALLASTRFGSEPDTPLPEPKPPRNEPSEGASAPEAPTAAAREVAPPQGATATGSEATAPAASGARSAPLPALVARRSNPTGSKSSKPEPRFEPPAASGKPAPSGPLLRDPAIDDRE